MKPTQAEYPLDQATVDSPRGGERRVFGVIASVLLLAAAGAATMFGWERALGLSGAIAGVVALGAGVLALIAAVTWMVSLARRVKHGATLGDKKSGLLFGVIATVVGALATVAATSVGMARDAGFDAGIAETSAPWLLAAFTLALAAWIFATWRASARTPMA